jgi:Cellulose binding domain
MAVSRWLAAGVAAGAGLVAAALAMAPGISGNASAEAATAGCTATAHIDSQWGSGPYAGEVVSFTVVNSSTTAANHWTVTWTLGSGQSVTSAWNASVAVSGTTATAVNAAWNGALAPGASTTFGMQLAGSGPAFTPLCSNDAPGPVTSSSASSGGSDVNLGVADSQTSVTLKVGQTLGVTLTSAYKPLSNSGAALALLSSKGGYNSGQPLVAQFQAVIPGTVTLSTTTDDPCLHASPPCAIPIALWTVQVTVVGTTPSASGSTVTVTTTNNRGSVSLHVGDILVVSLPAMYKPPTVVPEGVLGDGDVTGGYPTNQPLVARYAALAPGQVDVSTISDAACNHQATPCPSPQVPWTIHVTVTG